MPVYHRLLSLTFIIVIKTITIMPYTKPNILCSTSAATPWNFQKQCLKEYKSQRNPERFCQQYDFGSRKCTTCYDGYHLNQNNNCVLQTSEPEAIKGKLVTEATKIENSNQPLIQTLNSFCQVFKPNSIVCLKCYPGYFMFEDDCYAEERVYGKESYMSPGLASNYDLCQAMLPNGACQVCFADAVLIRNVCEFVKKTNGCEESQTCYWQETPCDLYSPYGVCKTCKSDSINIQGRCYFNLKKDMCLIKNNHTGLCEICVEAASLVNGTCEYKKPYCTKLSEKTLLCQQCSGVARLVSGACFKVAELKFNYQEPACLTWKAGKCVQCQMGSTINNFGFCIKQ